MCAPKNGTAKIERCVCKVFAELSFNFDVLYITGPLALSVECLPVV